ncbi:MAG TPA: glutamate 5-kinase [Wenzhouxiangellaceae bacterium]|nr:glutamate 5-kinase [Wenzhouxiangellaceae bacterium]
MNRETHASLAQVLSQGRAPLVVKIGSSLLVGADGAPRRQWMSEMARQLAQRPGPVAIVSSGAIALGRSALGIAGRPSSLAEAQAAAAVGQIRLAQTWSEAWADSGRSAAQLLLTLDDLEDRGRFLNARNTIETLLNRGIVPIVNENDTVATGEIRFGDNDRLGARVALLAGAELLMLLSDVDGLFDADPRRSEGGRLLPDVPVIDADIEALAGSAETTGFGTGGMTSKIAAARIATAGGCPVLLVSGKHQRPIQHYLETGIGTCFHASIRPLARRKQWLRSLQHSAGSLVLDDGAVDALARGASLLAGGIVEVRGQFRRGDLIELRGRGTALGHGLCGYDAVETRRIIGRHSREFESILGYAGRGPVVHRDDLVLFDR